MTDVAIIGRPNVGKSTLFNILTESRKALVKDVEGVTRDLMFEPCELWGKHFRLVDTGGITDSENDIFQKVRVQVLALLSKVQIIFFVVDGRVGPLPADDEIASLIHQSGKPCLVLVNKVDQDLAEADSLARLSDYSHFGMDSILTSFELRRGLSELLEWAYPQIEADEEFKRGGMRIALVGKPNVGKSSLVNTILGFDRSIVSQQAGTTTSAIEIEYKRNDRIFTLIDTAGVRKKAHEDLEVLSIFKTQESIRRSDMVLLLIDVVEGPTEQDARILSEALADHKTVLVVANKIDLADSEKFKNEFREKLAQNFHFYPDLEVVFVSAEEKRGIGELFRKIDHLASVMTKKVSTSKLNEFFMRVIRQAPAPIYNNRSVKFYYLTQTEQIPPSFIVFANQPDGVTESYRRFLIKNIKTEFDFWGVPIRVFIMKSRKQLE